jgi:hypothetical protein
MRLRHILIENFRGIKTLDWPMSDSNILCLIGKGDSTKSTILEAIYRAFHPRWNFEFVDSDFYQCRADKPINIRIVLGDIPDEFRDLAKYGHLLSGWNQETSELLSDPNDAIEDVICVHLRVEKDLQPKWSVSKFGRDDSVEFRSTDRSSVAVSLIGILSDRHLSWSNGSVLKNLTEETDIDATLVDASREARSAFETERESDSGALNSAASLAEQLARTLGVQIVDSYKAQLDSNTINIKAGGLSLHDGKIPLKQLGLGSKRLLTIGMQKSTLTQPHITLFDEVEIGLEPHRIARLISHLKMDNGGQYLLTTHSPIVLRELTINDLHIIHSINGRTEAVAASCGESSNFIQGKIRAHAEAFLAPKILVCEGATEVGFVRGFDEHWISDEKNSLAYRGIALLDANGASKIKETAKALKALRYDVAVFADSDATDQFSCRDEQCLNDLDVKVFVWSETLSIEQRLFNDLPWEGVKACFDLAKSLSSSEASALDQLNSQRNESLPPNQDEWEENDELRAALGTVAQKQGWFKTIEKGRALAEIVTRYFQDVPINSDLKTKITGLREWIDHDPT